jgi:general secretion pathway protein D
MLSLVVLALPPFVHAQTPSLDAPSFAAPATADEPILPPPVKPIPLPPAPQSEQAHESAAPTAPPPVTTLPPPPQHKAAETKPTKSPEDLAVALERPGDLNLQGLSLDKALFMIGEQWNINIVAGEVKGTVNGTFKQAPLREILDAILLSNGYNYRAVGKSLVISSIEQLGQINPFFQSAIIPVQTADIEEVVQGAQLLKTPKGEVRALKSAKSIVVLDFPDRVKMIREFVERVDTAGGGGAFGAEPRANVPLEVGYFRTQHISAKTASDALVPIMSKSGRAAIMEKEDRLLVADYPDNLAMVEKVLASIDRPRPQVRITALIYDISLRDIERIGINWNATFHGRPDASGDPQNSFGVDSLTTLPFPSGTAGNTLTLMSLNRHIDITAVARFLASASDARLLADPNVLVLENEEAHFERVSEIPYQQLTQTQQGGSIGTTAFKKAGTTLNVTPKIAADGLIRLMVRPEVSRLTGFTPGDNQPIIDTNSAQTTLSVFNRQTVVIGGLRQRSDVGTYNGIPYLKDLHVVGRLFRSRDTDVRESELVVFVMPEIVGYSDDPTCRQKLADETIRCRLDQIPEGEGCPPCCRRLPPEAVEGPMPTPAGAEELPIGQPVPMNGNETSNAKPHDITSLKYSDSLEPLSAANIPSSEFQFGRAGQNEQVRALVAEGKLRRLPLVTKADLQVVTTSDLFAAPPAAKADLAPMGSDQVRTATLESRDSQRR